MLTDALAVEALVEKNPLRVAGLEVDPVADAAFRGKECVLLSWACDVAWAFFFVLVELFPVGAMPLILQPGFDFRGEVGGAGRDDPAVGKGIEKNAGEAIAIAIDQAEGVGILIERVGSFFKRNL